MHLRRMSTLKDMIRPSRFAHALKAEPVIPSVADAIALYEQENHMEKVARFNKPRLLSSGAFQYTVPTERKSYRHLLSSPRAVEDLGLSIPMDMETKELISGAKVHYNDEIFPYAQAYAGFQFGQFAGQLGDGRVINLFDIETAKGDRYEVQIKGAGKTAFSRFADGKAVIRSSIREFVISEALHGLNIPTTRALAITLLPGTMAQRSYAEQCAVVTRYATGWIRMGTFDLYRYRKDRQGLRELCDYVIKDVLHELPPFKQGEYTEDKHKDLTEGEEPPTNLMEITENSRYDLMYRAIVRLNARTVAHWQVYGFLNGVLNTDNTSITGLSMDFGPFSFLDKFDPKYTPNHDDVELRYSYENQPSVIWWNLTRLGESLVELLGAGPDLIDDEFFVDVGVREDLGPKVIKRAEAIIQLASNEYRDVFMVTYNSLIGKRLGLNTLEEDDHVLFDKLLDVLYKTQVDYNQFFTNLQNSNLDDHMVFLSKDAHERYVNPQDKIDVERNEEVRELITEWLSLYNQRLSKAGISHEDRRSVAKQYNPLFIPRNWMLEEVISEVENSRGDDSAQLAKLVKMSSYPYNPEKWGDNLKDVEQRWMDNEVEHIHFMKQCSCSS